ncbi:hypothetical protein [Magnetofaba australis]|uniref:N-acetyltransferase domain-containing protein n=1 Tax=Magnetofaba australis IT-1 TaxID=1434232 RepID=A0A1Y2K7R1_9PROT|nr:hypothetical protein [Magnetofaba australis]OSM06781.1 hypothetical protein MAIT1_00357 [Magnetofaba australis IT-1]
MSGVEIRLCAAHERERVMAFLRQYWSAKHVLAHHKGLFEWQYRSVERDGYDYFLAWRGEELLGVLGFIDSRRYDPQLTGRNVAWLALWKVRDDAGVAGLGLQLLLTMMRELSAACFGVVGINPTHPPMYRALRYVSDELTQYLLLRPDAPTVLTHRPDDFVIPPGAPGAAQLRLLDAAALAQLDVSAIDDGQIPAKSARHFHTRFLEHPYYTYRVYAVVRADKPVALLAARRAEHAGVGALRLVDFWGDIAHLGQCGDALRAELAELECEYADLCAALPDDAPLAEAGFFALDPDGAFIAPNYFEPFEQRNVRIRYAFKGEAAPSIFRADGDQDRPNQLSAENM